MTIASSDCDARVSALPENSRRAISGAWPEWCRRPCPGIDSCRR
jgi:hypothetical protein